MDPVAVPPARRRPTVAAILSAAIPGLGQLYNGQPGKTAFIVFCGMSGYLSSFIFALRSPLLLQCASIVTLVIWGAGVVDAFRTARKKREILLRPYQRWYVYFGFAAALLIFHTSVTRFVKTNYAQAFTIPSTSMAPTLKSGDHIIVDMSYYRNAQPQRGDVVVLTLPEDPETNVLKRVVAIAGDTVEIDRMSLLVNGKKVETPNANWQSGGRKNFGPATVPPGTLFLLGDNRDFSKDSRYWETTFPETTRVIGKVLYIYFPVDRAGTWIE